MTKYDSNYWNSYEDTDDFRSLNFYNVIEELEGLTAGSYTKWLLDIGCGDTEFIRQAFEQGWNCVGMEVNDKQILTVINNNFACCGDRVLLDGTFDVVVMLDSIEHFESISGILANVYRYLRKGGVLYISTPNKHSIFSWLTQRKPEHINLMTKNRLEFWLSAASFKIINISRSGKSLKLSYIAKILEKDGKNWLARLVKLLPFQNKIIQFPFGWIKAIARKK